MHEALRAADVPAADGIAARVVDLYSIKPVDTCVSRTVGGTRLAGCAISRAGGGPLPRGHR
ncbi:MAG TPA: transketolase C-terminal domain-containing protein [Streptosporangiaceae bacterium]|nr:transketolase C-terminal domain-containing protein [Streptosporangiaceae bacterium]